MVRPWFEWSLRAVALATAVFVAAGCLLAGPIGTAPVRGAVPPVESSVAPTFICPGDPVEVRWDGGPVGDCENVGDDAVWGSGCDEMITRTAVSVQSTPDLFAGSPVAPRETRGSRTVNPDRDTRITVGFTRANGDLSYSESVEVSVFEDGDAEGAIFDRQCVSGGGVWGPLWVRPGNTLPARLVIVEVCNPNSFEVTVRVAESGTDFRLAPGSCTGELRGSRRIELRDLDPVAEAGLLAGERCSGGPAGIPGNDVSMEVKLTCEAG